MDGWMRQGDAGGQSTALAGQALPAAQGKAGRERLIAVHGALECPVLSRAGPVRLEAVTARAAGGGVKTGVGAEAQAKQPQLAVAQPESLHIKRRQRPETNRSRVLDGLGAVSRPAARGDARNQCR